jgi:hypothetical protein
LGKDAKMIPLKIQNAQIGALSADKAYQSQKNSPQNAQRLFEAEVKKQMDEAQIRTREAEKSEKSTIHDESEDKKNEQEQNRKEKKPGDRKEKQARKNCYNIEKSPNGKIKHLDVKI